MQDTLRWIVEAVQDVNAFLTTATPVRAVLAGWLVSWAATQAIKFAPALQTLPSDLHRAYTRLIAFDLAAVTTGLLWPGEFGGKLLSAALVGWFAPTAYAVLARVLYHFFPWLETRLSARPGSSEDGP